MSRLEEFMVWGERKVLAITYMSHGIGCSVAPGDPEVLEFLDTRSGFKQVN